MRVLSSYFLVQFLLLTLLAAGWIISQVLSTGNYNTQMLVSRLAVLEKKLKKQEEEMSKLMGQAWKLKGARTEVDVKKEFEQVVWRFCEEQKKYGLKGLGDDDSTATLTVASPLKRRTTTATFQSSP